MSKDNERGTSYSPPELTEYGEIEELTEQGYGRGPPDEPPGGGGGRGPPG